MAPRRPKNRPRMGQGRFPKGLVDLPGAQSWPEVGESGFEDFMIVGCSDVRISGNLDFGENLTELSNDFEISKNFRFFVNFRNYR